MKVKVLHPFGRYRTVGEIIDLPHRQARTLTAIGKTTMDVGSQRPKRTYRRRDMVAEPAAVAAPAPVTADNEPVIAMTAPADDPTDA